MLFFILRYYKGKIFNCVSPDQIAKKISCPITIKIYATFEDVGSQDGERLLLIEMSAI